MLWRAIFLLLALFWGVMNVQLWRTEYGGHNSSGGPVPLGIVWHKILTAPDSSLLSILYQNRRIGFCRWTPLVAREETIREEDYSPEGQVRRVAGYYLQMEGNVLLQDLHRRARFDCQLQLATNRVWQELSMRLNLRPGYWELRSVNADQVLRLKVEDEALHFQKAISFAQLRSPETLLRDLAGPLPSATVAALSMVSGLSPGRLTDSALEIHAFRDTLLARSRRTRVYRVEALLLDRFRAVAYISQVGEILRLELPGDLLLLNDEMGDS